MSHIVEIRTEVRDANGVRAACDRLRLEPPVEGKTRLFSSGVEGLAVWLRGWRYPIVFQTATGEAQYDNYNGRWGDPSRLSQFLQAYAVETAKIEARRKGHSVTEQNLTDGYIKLTVQVGGAV